MSFARFHRQLSLAVLAALFMRAIIPLGYMPGNLLAGEFMLFCPSGGGAAFLPPPTATSGHHHEHHAGADDAQDEDGNYAGNTVGVDSSCPIGSVLVAACLPNPEPADIALDRSPAAIGTRHSLVFSSVPIRNYQVRAPPTFLHS